MTKKPDLENIRKWFWRLKNAILIWLGQLGCLKTEKKMLICYLKISLYAKLLPAITQSKIKRLGKFFSHFLRIDRCTHSYQAITKKPQKSPLIKDVVYSRYHSALRTQLRRWYFSEMLREGLLRLDQDIKTLVLAEFGTAKAEK